MEFDVNELDEFGTEDYTLTEDTHNISHHTRTKYITSHTDRIHHTHTHTHTQNASHTHIHTHTECITSHTNTHTQYISHHTLAEYITSHTHRIHHTHTDTECITSHTQNTNTGIKHSTSPANRKLPS